MTNQEHAAALQADVDEDVNRLGTVLHEAFMLAQKLERRGVDMRKLGLYASEVKSLRDRAEDAFTMGKAKIA